MKKGKNENGFSLIELMLAAIVTGVLALTMGVTVFFVYKGWQQNLAAVELQRNAYTTMRQIAREIRHTEADEISIPDSGTLNLGENNQFSPPLPVRTFSINSGHLMFNNSRILIDSSNLTATNLFSGIDNDGDGNWDAVEIILQLHDTDAAHSSTHRFIINARN